MKKHLFYTFLSIFVATAVITLLGVVKVVDIEEGYLQVLFTSLIIELVGSVIGLYRTTDFFGGGDCQIEESASVTEGSFLQERQEPPAPFPPPRTALPVSAISASGEGTPARTYKGAFEDFISELEAVNANFLQQQELRDNWDGARVRWTGKVSSVSARREDRDKVSILLSSGQEDRPLSDFGAVCSTKLREKAFSLRKGDTVTVHGVLDTSLRSCLWVSADALEYESDVNEAVE
jgi:hypothetical protein